MAENNQDLWPDDIGVTGDLKPPVEVLREQAAHLAKKTRNLVEGEVRTEAQGEDFFHSFVLLAPAINNYRYRLFRVSHPIQFYPLQIIDDAEGRIVVANSQDEFFTALKDYFGSDRVKAVVKALVAQSQGTVAA